MQVEIKIDPSCAEPKVIVWTAAVTEQITQLVSRLQEGPAQILTGSRDGQLEILPPDKIVRIYAAGGRVYAATAQGEYLLRLRLYELEGRLDPRLLVVGNETVGMSAGWREACDTIAEIPMGGSASSLNAAVAGSIALYETGRQRGTGR